jgi:hypothetical protein
MSKDEILKVLQDKKTNAVAICVTTDKGEKAIFNTKDGWRMSCYLGNLYYTDEELAEELEEWNEVILSID